VLLKEAVEEEEEEEEAEEEDDDDGAARVSLTMALTGFQRGKCGCACERAIERKRDREIGMLNSALFTSHTRRLGKTSSGGKSRCGSKMIQQFFFFFWSGSYC
jgi:hypothetical protein